MPPRTFTWTFPHSRSPQLPMILELARQGQYEERRVCEGKKETLVYTTTFTLTPDPQSIRTLMRCAEVMGRVRGASVTIDGLPPAHRYGLQDILHCYARSLQLSDPRGYCWVPDKLDDPTADAQRERAFQQRLEKVAATVAGMQARLDDPVLYDLQHPHEGEEEEEEDATNAEEPPTPLWLFPCRLATSYASIQRPSRQHPASLRSQVEGRLVERGCLWCPALRLDEWTERYG